MEQQAKRIKYTKESVVSDIASSIGDTANSLESMSESYNDILRINALVVRYLLNAEKREKAINQTTEHTTDIEHTSIRKKH